MNSPLQEMQARKAAALLAAITGYQKAVIKCQQALNPALHAKAVTAAYSNVAYRQGELDQELQAK